MKTDSVRAILICGRKTKMWTLEAIEKNLKEFEIDRNDIDNEEMRRLMFDVKDICGEAADMYKYNSIFVHSATRAITAVVANLALNRVHTSVTAEEKGRFEYQLYDLQLKRTERGNTIADKKAQKKPKPQEDDENPRRRKSRKRAAGDALRPE